MAVSWGNAECFDERPGKRLATAAASSAALEMPGRPLPRRDAGGKSVRDSKAAADDRAS
jgi:hypothetical protein